MDVSSQEVPSSETFPPAIFTAPGSWESKKGEFENAELQGNAFFNGRCRYKWRGEVQKDSPLSDSWSAA